MMIFSLDERKLSILEHMDSEGDIRKTASDGFYPRRSFHLL